MIRSLIDELQLAAADETVSVSTLLRKALVVAAKLGLEDVPQWINNELSGYYGSNDWPAYRKVKGRVRAKDMYRRSIDAHFDSTELENSVSEQPIRESVADLENLLSSEGIISISYSADQQMVLRKIFHSDDLHFICVIERARIAAILDEVRNEVLRWAIALDKAGVRGAGLSFSPVEKELAQGLVVHNTGTMTIGNVGSVSDYSVVAAGHSPQIHNAITAPDLLKLLAEINTYAPQIAGFSQQDTIELGTAVAELNEAAQATPVVGEKLRKPLDRIIGAIRSAGETVITTGLKFYVEQWMKSHGLAP